MSRESRKSVAGRRVTVAALAPGAIALALTVAATPSFAASGTHLGQRGSNYFCNSADQWIQTGSAGRSYVVPKGATELANWSTSGGAAAGTMQFELWRRVSGNDYKLVYISAPTILQAGVVTKVVIEPEVRVKAGDVIGYRAVTETDCALMTNDTGDKYLYDPGSSTPTVGSTVAFQGPATGFRFDASAVVR